MAIDERLNEEKMSLFSPVELDRGREGCCSPRCFPTLLIPLLIPMDMQRILF